MNAPASSATSSSRKPLWKRMALIVCEVILIFAVIGLIVATLLPVYHGASPDAAREQPAGPGRRR